VFIEPQPVLTANKWRNRAVAAAGKRSVVITPDAAEDTRLLEQILRRVDIVLLSSDVSPLPPREWRPDQIVCDITAFGHSGPLAGEAYSDALVQAVSAIAESARLRRFCLFITPENP